MSGGAPGVLFVTYDGVLAGPARSQVLPYVKGYAAAGWRTALLSWEREDLAADGPRVAEIEADLAAAGVGWRRLPWRRSAVRDLVAGWRAVRAETARLRPDVLHARSYVPALVGLLAARPRGVGLLFDMRGLWPDERVDGGLWRAGGCMHRAWRRIERTLLRRADGVVVLARAGTDLLLREGLLPPATPRAVIPCGADLARFRPLGESAAPAALEPFLGHRIYTFLGATGTWYLLDAMLDFAADTVAADDGARILFLTEDPQGAVRSGLEARGVPSQRFLVARAPHADVPAWLGPSHAGVFFIRSCRSKQASCPTKLGEFLACGVPVVINEGVGDTAEVVRAARAGVVVGGFDRASYAGARRALADLRADGELPRRCRAEAERRFDAAACAARFVRVAEAVRARSRCGEVA